MSKTRVKGRFPQQQQPEALALDRGAGETPDVMLPSSGTNKNLQKRGKMRRGCSKAKCQWLQQ